jgi:hypothetical protein
MLDLLGCSSDDIDTGKINWRDITPAEYRQLDDQALEEICQHGRCSPFEKEYCCINGARIPVLIEAAAFGGRVLGSGSFFAVDLRNRKRLPEIDDRAAEVISKLSPRQRLICLLSSYGLTQNRIAGLLDMGRRTVELERHRAAITLGLSTPGTTLWSVSNQKILRASAITSGLLTPSIVKVIERYVGQTDLFKKRFSGR